MIKQLIDAYTIKEFETLTNKYIDKATADNLYNHFIFRYIDDPEEIKTGKDEENVSIWEKHFLAKLSEVESQYNQYLRIETIQIDPMVTEYFESWDETKGNAKNISDVTNSGTSITTNSGTSGNDTTTTTNENDDTNSTTNADTLTMTAQLPQSISYNSATSGLPNSLDWRTASSQAESKTESTTNTTASKNEQSTIKNTGTTTDRTEATDNSTINQTSSSDTSLTSKNLSTGRHGYSPQELLTTAREYIKKTNSFLWLCNELEDVFFGIFEI